MGDADDDQTLDASETCAVTNTRPQGAASKRLLALAIGIVLAGGLLGVAEGIARWVNPREDPAFFSDATLRTRNRRYVSPHETRGFALVPFEAPDFHIDADGFRGVSTRSVSEAGRPVVILALGDSTTFGWWVRDRETWPAQLQRLLDSSGRGVQVRNAGVPSYTSSQVKVQLEEIMAAVHPDVILASVLWNDLWFSRVERWYPELLIQIEPKPWRRILYRHSALYRRLAFPDRVTPGESPQPSPLARQHYVENVGSIASLAAQSDVPLFLVKPPFDAGHVAAAGVDYLKLGAWPTSDLLREARIWLAQAELAAARFGAEPIDHRLAVGTAGQSERFLDEIHPNGSGYAQIAEDVAFALRAALPERFTQASE